jgi:hypothetical protein
MLVHVVQRLQKSSMARSALVVAADNVDPSTFATDRNIHKELRSGTVAIQQVTSTMRTRRNHRLLLGGDLVVVCALFNGQYTPMGPSQYVQRVLPRPQILLELFSLNLQKSVKEGDEGEKLLPYFTQE